VAEVQPAYVLHNAGAVHTGETHRMMVSGFTAGARAASSLIGRGGVNAGHGGGMVVSPSGTPSLTLQIASGVAFVPGSEGSRQGVYVCVNDATKNLVMDAAHGSLPRIDLVVVRVRDSFYSGATNDWLIDKVTGTAAASPTAPAMPVNSLLLATISRSAGDDTIASGDITDSRTQLAAAGGTISCHSSASAALVALVPEGQFVYETDQGRLWVKRSGAIQYMSHYQGGVQHRFTANGTWNKPTGAKLIRVQVQGGGGAGGGAGATGAGQASAGGGGQGGAYAESWILASAVGSSVAVTVGAGGTGVSGATGNAGGTSSFGALVSAAGGAGAGVSGASTSQGVVSGGTGAQAMTGDIQIAGGGGGAGVRIPTNAVAGIGGGAHLGNGGGVAGTVQNGVGYGGGGSGAANGESSAAKAGGNGAAGIVIVTTFM
jgi:hypothetical protein